MTFPKTFLLCTASLVGLVLASAIAEPPFGIQVEFANVSQIGDGPRLMMPTDLAQANQYSSKPEGSKLLLTLLALNAMTAGAAAAGEVAATNAPAISKPQSLVAGELELKEDSEQIEFFLPTASKAAVRHFELQSPIRVVIDVNGSVYTVSKQSVKINSDLIRKIRFGYGDTEHGKLVRCVFDLWRKATYAVAPAEDGALICFQKGSGDAAALKTVVPSDSVTRFNLQRAEGDNQGGIRLPAKAVTPAAVAIPEASQPVVAATSARPAVSKPQALVAGELELKEDSEQIELFVPTANKVTVRHFELPSPNRVVIDINGSVYTVSKQFVKVNSDLIRKIRFGYGESEQGKLVRCVLDLSRKAPYAVTAAEGGVLVRFQKESGVGAALKKVVHFDSVSRVNPQRAEGGNQGGIRVQPKAATPAAVAIPEVSQPVVAASPSMNNASPAMNNQLLPFRVGEKLSYRISWSNIVEAGTAELSVTAEEGKPNSLRLQAKATTAAAVAGSYPFKDDDFVSHFDTLACSPWLYEKNFTERKRVVHDRVAFNQAQRTALYTNSRNQSKQIPIELGTQDPVSSLYAIRSLRLTPGMQVTFPVLDGGIQYLLEARVVGSELITIKMGSFNAHRLDVNLRRESGAVTNRSITAWISADARSLPVLVSVALPVGAAVIELASVTP